ncbi:MAG: chorismate mutase [Spirochaetales bacterium]|nr:chorismate mutase [Spirochaetales bacterium]
MGEIKLNEIAAFLEGLEETIIYKLIDRIQFKRNEEVYKPGASGFPGETASLFELRLRYQEEMDSLFGRFNVPEERPFNKQLPPPRRQRIDPDSPLHIRDFDGVNLTPQILQSYLDLLPRICSPGDDGHYGSSCEHDVYALQAISRRIHYGAFYVGEAKYRSNPSMFQTVLKEGNRASLLEALTRKEVEDQILSRVRQKAETIQATIRTPIRTQLNAAVVADFYRDTIIPLTKEGELLYLQHRLDT